MKKNHNKFIRIILNLIPDKLYLKLKFKHKTGKKLNLKDPKTFNEKLQWLKLYDRNPEYTKMVDKFEVKKYISEVLGEEYVIPTLGVYDKFSDIEFEKLPDQFVIKCTHDSGGVVICKDKNKLDIEQARNKINESMKRNFYYISREFPYKNVKPRIIIEKYMKTNNNKELQDYKFYCFNGKPEFLSTSIGMGNHETAKLSFMDMEYKIAKFSRGNDYPLLLNTNKPINFDKMVEMAKKLSTDIPFVRVDFYEIEGQVYFGELTFYPTAGFKLLTPEKYEILYGDMLELPKNKKN